MSYKRRRHPVEILLAVLEHAKEPQKKTHIMYKSSTTWSTLQKMFTFLEERGFFERVMPPPVSSYAKRKDRRVDFLYKTTRKGLEALKQWESMDLVSELFEYSQEGK